jgi:phosphatidylglycerophosphatase A
MPPPEAPAPKKGNGTADLTFFTRVVATGFFTGYIHWASGTFGTLVGVLIYLIPGVESPAIFLPLIALGFWAGVITSSRVARAVGNQLTSTAEHLKARFQFASHRSADPSIVVIDEIVGMWIALLFVPKIPAAIVIAFLSFRLFDIVKPAPARNLEQLPTGWGIMLDDVVAGVYANIVTQLSVYALIATFPHLL